MIGTIDSERVFGGFKIPRIKCWHWLFLWFYPTRVFSSEDSEMHYKVVRGVFYILKDKRKKGK